MIKFALGRSDFADFSLLSVLSEYLNIMKIELLAATEMLTCINDDCLDKCVMKYEEKSKLILDLYNKQLKMKRVKAISDRRSFDRFCLRIYEIFEIFLLGIRRKAKEDKSFSNTAGMFLMKIQNVFQGFRSDQEEVDIGLFLAKIRDVEVDFILGCFKKVKKNMIKDIHPELLKRTQLKLAATTRFPFPEKFPYELPVQEPKSTLLTNNTKCKQTSLATPIKPTFKYSNELYKTIRTSDKVFNKCTKIHTNVCKNLDIMEVSNWDIIFNSTYQQLYQELSEVNAIKKIAIGDFILNKRIKSRIKKPNLLSIKKNHHSSSVIDPPAQIKLQQIRNDSMQCQLKRKNMNTLLLHRISDYENLNYIVPFDRVWSITKQKPQYKKPAAFITTINDFYNKQHRKNFSLFPCLPKS